jgi:hypothetical protein
MKKKKKALLPMPMPLYTSLRVAVFCAAVWQDKPCDSSFPRHGALVTPGVIGMPPQEVRKDRRLNETGQP